MIKSSLNHDHDDLNAMTQAAGSLRSHESGPLFHTPPPVDRSKSWLVEKSEKESYGIVDDGNGNREVEALLLTPPIGSKESSLKSSRSSTTSLERVMEEVVGRDGVESGEGESGEGGGGESSGVENGGGESGGQSGVSVIHGGTPIHRRTPPPLPRRSSNSDNNDLLPINPSSTSVLSMSSTSATTEEVSNSSLSTTPGLVSASGSATIVESTNGLQNSSSIISATGSTTATITGTVTTTISNNSSTATSTPTSTPTATPTPSHPSPLLPRKLITSVDSFIHSLQEPKYMTPLGGNEIADLYQDFYHQFKQQAEDYVIGTSSSSKNRSPKEVQMQSYREIAEKKRERSLRPSRIKTLTESAEVLACETVYNKIFSPSYGDDRSRNDYIQSRVRSLKAIPITLNNLALPINESELLPLINDANGELINMDKSKNPKLKLEFLLKTHKILVSALSNKRSDQTSADSILPLLIFTFIHYEVPNLWLNMNFIKRFRNKQYLQGEDMYCLTNFEAAIEFLETLTLEALSIDMNSIPTTVDITPLITKPDSDPLKHSSPRSSRSNSLQQPNSTSPRRQSSSPNVSNSINSTAVNGGLLGKRLSILYPGDLASNAVNSADQSIKSLSSTVGSSYKFLVGRFLEKKDGQNDEKYPDTLAEARKVVGLDVSSDPSLDHSLGSTFSDENLSNVSTSSPTRDITTPVNAPTAATAAAGAGTGTSNSTTHPPPLPPFPTFHPQTTTSRSRSSSLHLTNNNLGSTESIIGKFAGGVIRNFRSPSFSQHNDETPESTTPNKISKPIDRLLSTDTDSLKLSDIKDLHADYKRLVSHLKSLNAFE